MSQLHAVAGTDKQASPRFDVFIIGAGSGGISVAASLLARNARLRIAIADPSESHYYQPGWTMVGGGVFDARSTRRNTRDLIPSGVEWVKKAVTQLLPAEDCVEMAGGERIYYGQLIVAPGLKLDWDAIPGLKDGLGRNGITSNYSYETAPYTWELVKSLNKGTALFTQPPMPIKCAGAPQKALYLSCDEWRRQGKLGDIDVGFHNAGGVLFGVSEYVPALQSYMDKYGVDVRLNQRLTEIDGQNRVAVFSAQDSEGVEKKTTRKFDMLHVCPPQKAPEFVANSELADEGGWLDVDQYSLRHMRFPNVWGLGDVMNTPNAKTMAAVRKQVPVVAENVCRVMAGGHADMGYDGYGSCPLTVERGKIVLAEFGYGGKILPTFPTWLVEGKQATRAAWFLKASVLPAVYWHAMLKGREWMAAPQRRDVVAAA